MSVETFLILGLKNLAAIMMLLATWKYCRLIYEREKIKQDKSHCKRNFVKSLILGSIILLAGWYLTEKTGQMANNELSNNLLTQSITAATSINQEQVLTLTGTGADFNNPYFEQLRNQLAAIRSANTQSRFVYLLQLRRGEIIFLADGEPLYSNDYSPPGQVYEETSDAVIASFISGQPFIEGPIQDRWGTWISGHAPIKTSEGKVIALLGIDIDAKNWPAKIAVYRLVAITTTLLVFLAAMFLS
nr:PDC sensor domain-containing protein [Desulforamulus aquiferis]